MATRRARIKAVVASLPARRKQNQASSESCASTQALAGTESPRTAPGPAPTSRTPNSDLAIRTSTPATIIKTPVPAPTAASRGPIAVSIPVLATSAVSAATAPAPTVDGITPLDLAPAHSLETLKSEMLSESAHVLFDPLVPLPSPVRARCKLRPAPRLPSTRPATFSLHGSASESEDEGRRRDICGDSFSKQDATPGPGPAHVPAAAPAAAASAPAPAPAPASPTKEKHFTHRRSRRAPAERDRLTMYDLIFYNPTTNPIRATEEPAPQLPQYPRPASPAPAPAASAAPASPRAPAPQIKIGADGQIVVDEQSLVLERTRGAGLSEEVVRESAGRGGRYTRATRTKSWSHVETVRFYRALAAIGTDFSLMLPLFPDRSRRDLKMKFKKEERSNGAQVEVALSARQRFAADKMAVEFARERAEAAQQAERVRLESTQLRRQHRQRTQRARRHGVALSKAGCANVELLTSARAGRAAPSADNLLALERLECTSPATTAAAPRPRTYELPRGTSPSALAGRVAPGSLVCLTMGAGGARVLQTYVADATGQLTPIAVSPAVLGTLAGYMASPAQ